ncbi:MAG: type II secretion system protein N [Rudaea sp.]
MRRIVFYFLVVALCAGVAAWTCPAAIAYRWFASRLGPLALADLSGSLWHGHAGSMRVFGRELGTLDWQLQALPLLSGNWVAQVNVSGGDATVQATLTRSADRQLDIRDATIQLPATVLEPAIGVPNLHLQGRIEITLTQARLRGAWVESANGNALWRDAAVSGAAQARLSDLRATFVTMPDGRISGELRDLGGPLLADGMFTTVAGRYEAELRLAARGDDTHVLDALQYVGEPQTDGSVLLKIRGQLLKVF